MINHIKINNFKSFSSESINFGKITLLTGLNSSGKSTVITSLLLPMQMDDNVLNMNSDYFQLGTFGDILHQWANTDELKIEYSTSEGDSFLLFKYNSVLENESQITCDASSNLNLITYPNIVYISAQRIVPTLYYERSNITSKNNTSDIHGSNSISLLAAKKNNQIENKLMLHNEADKYTSGKLSLISNINAWMNKISPGVTLNAETLFRAGISTLEFGYKNESIMRPVSCVNVGFGLTHVLPIILNGLLTKPGDIFIVENPEAHLHPAGQTHMGLFLSKLASSGVQVIIETHSDHIFNGIRLSIKDKILSHDDAKFIFFDKRSEGEGSTLNIQSKMHEVLVSDSGKLISAPVGFFDEWEESLYKLL
ncbi:MULTISPECIES: AAA family ATPase [Aeromonas]|uniref:AAA family ATPase n=1 Tax=Aeromonas TaxID=642 RepID=UPI000CD13532|nr:MULTISPECIES: DUF3696 domain-containing protein [Aeromonas]AUT40323.1 hypothetical protein C2U30_00425 [Aeromonas sp. ASNIH5]MDX7797950.1 AAA family ATPase [Aeromonas caviae]WKL90308.1 AAA family ATPase [Aeromonas caviae]